MKQINSLVVLNVPKDSRNHRITIYGMREYCQWDIGAATGVDKLPHQKFGQYEIIGLYSEATHIQIRAAYDAAGKPWAGSIWEWLDMPTDTTDLLFIHKLK